jgi:molybdopterin converting factor small subunit
MMETHEITLHLFANLRERVGTDTLMLRVPTSCTVNDLKALLRQSYPSLASHLYKVVVIVNNRQVYTPEEVLPLNADLTIMPPFGGG